jgi:hypothetical protein
VPNLFPSSTSTPFALSLSKRRPSLSPFKEQGQGFDKPVLGEAEGLSPNDEGCVVTYVSGRRSVTTAQPFPARGVHRDEGGSNR